MEAIDFYPTSFSCGFLQHFEASENFSACHLKRFVKTQGMDLMYIPFRLFPVLTMWIAATWTKDAVSQLYMFTTVSRLKQPRNTYSSKKRTTIETFEMLFLMSCMHNSFS